MTARSLRHRLTLPVPWHARQGGAALSALVWRGRAVSYGALSARADDLAGRLAGAGVEPGDRVAVLLPNRPLFVALVHAAARIGVTLVPLNVRLTADELVWQLADAQPRLVVADSALLDHLGLPMPAGSVPMVVVAPRVDLVAGSETAISGAETAADQDLPLLAELPRSDVPLNDSVDPDSLQAIIYTSGTSGRPKGAVLTHGAHAWSAAASAVRLGVAPDDRWLVPLPLFHVGGLAALLRCAWYGTAVSLQPRFEAPVVARELQSGDVTLASLVPTMLTRVLDVWGDKPAPEALRAVLLGGGPVPGELLERAASHRIPIALTYGLTEAASQVATAAPTRQPRLDEGLPPLPFTELRIVDDDGRSSPGGTVGEITVRGPSVTAGYWNDRRATEKKLSGGWLHTGDGGCLDKGGRLHVFGRRADLIVTGGENVYPAEIEAVFDRHPAVSESCVVGVPDPEWGSLVVAVVVQGGGSDVSERELEVFARDRLAGYKVPRQIVWRVRPLPRTAAGKLRRAEVRELLIGGSFVPPD
jgi:O-succinylbenzoic acid--CoA ligase